MPWKNGGGTTTEIAVFPEGAGLDTFEWRVSMARVEGSGPFSAFPGVDRTLSILRGATMQLDIQGMSPVFLDENSAPFSFPADVPTSALLREPITDLNVMTRRGAWRHSVERLMLEAEALVTCETNTTLVFATEEVVVVLNGERVALASSDCLVIDSPGDVLRLEPGADCDVFVIRLTRA